MEGGEVKVKRKVVILTIAVMLIAGITQVGFAESGERIREACRDFLENLTPEQQQQVDQAREQYRADSEELKEDYRAKRTQLRENFFNELPEEAREHFEERMNEKAERRAAKMENRGGGHGRTR